MSTRTWTVAILTIFLAASMKYVLAQDAAPPAPTTQPTPRTHLPADFARMTDLTDDEKSQILSIRESTDQQMRALAAKEKSDELAVLTDAQRDELKDIDAKIASERRSHLAEERRQERIESTEQKLDELKGQDQPTTNPSAQN
jgi:hypothetical protein